MKRKINTSLITKNYNEKFSKEIINIKNIYKLPYCEFLHIGSTALKNSYGEEIIDVLVTVNNLHDITNFDEKRFNLLKYHRTSHGLKGLISYCKIDDFYTMTYTTRLFIVQKDSPTHKRFLTFHNLLMTNKEVFEHYQNFKKENIEEKAKNKVFTQKKNNFIAKLLERFTDE